MKENQDNTCPKCGSSIPSEAPGGLCPACVLEGAATIPSPTSSGGKRNAPPSVAEIAPHFPELEIEELLGAGGMGAVYKARQPQLDRTVAIKILSEDLAGDPSFTERFNREAKVLAKLNHPNIVGVFEFGAAGPYCFLTMEYVDGVNLRQALRTGGFTPTEALDLVQEICSALQFAHSEGILHRDIKPENVLIDSKGRVKIADFGIAKLVGQNDPSDVTLTMEGSILGSPQYMAPEQIETPGDVDQRADIYSLGVVLYEMLTGELPIGRFSLPSEKAPLDARIDDIVMRTLEKERELRYQTVSDVKTSVEAIDDPARPSEAAFITDQIQGLSKMTFWIAIIFLAWLFFEAISGIFGDIDDSLKSSDRLPYLVGAAVLLSMISGVLAVVHKIRTGEIKTTLGAGNKPGGNAAKPASTPVGKPEPIQQEPGSARFSTASAIFTGISLLFAVLALVVVPPLLRELGTPSSSPGTTPAEVAERYGSIVGRAVVMGLTILAVGVPALLGFIFGIGALVKIRRSGGQKTGLGASVFSTLAWPVLLAGFFSSSFLFLVAKQSEGPGAGIGMGPLTAILFLGIPQILIAVVMVRALRRWAGGVTSDEGNRIHPGLGRAFLMAAGLLIIGPVLMSVAGGFLVPNEPRHPFAESPMGMEKNAAVTSQPVEVASDLTHIDLDLSLAPGLMATYELVRTDAVGNEKIIDDHQGFILASDERPWKGTVALSANRYESSHSDGGWWEMIATLRSQSPNVIQVGDELVSDFDLAKEWTWDDAKPLPQEFSEPGQRVFEVARNNDLSQVLSLRVVAQPRQVLGIPSIALDQVKLENAVCGLGEDIDWIRYLVDELGKIVEASDLPKAPREPEPEWREGKPESHVNLTIEPGLVAKIELKGPDGNGEQKTFHRGYIVSSDLEPWEGKLRVGSLAGSSQIQWRIEGPYETVVANIDPGREWDVDPMATDSRVTKPDRPTVKVITAGMVATGEGASPISFVVVPITRKSEKADLPEVMAFNVMGLGEDPDWVAETRRTIEMIQRMENAGGAGGASAKGKP